MIESYLTHGKILEGEPYLDGYLKQGEQIDFKDIMDEAYHQYLTDVKNRRKDLRKLGIRLSLQTSVTKTAAFDSIISAQDFVERRRLVIDCTDITGNAIFNLQGTNDDGTNYYDISSLIMEDGKTGEDIQFSTIGKRPFVFMDVYEKYRLRLISIGTTITYSAYLYETTFDFPLIYLTRAKIYNSLYLRQSDDNFLQKAEKYENMYGAALEDTYYFYDKSGDETISEEEAETSIGEVTFRP